jgi:hypothetical protein
MIKKIVLCCYCMKLVAGKGISALGHHYQATTSRDNRRLRTLIVSYNA